MLHENLTIPFDLDDTRTTLSHLFDACSGTVCIYTNPILCAIQHGELKLSMEEKQMLMDLCVDIKSDIDFIEKHIGSLKASLIGENYEESEE